MSRIQNSWALAKSSWNVLRSDKQLTWFPVLSAIASVAVVLLLSVLIWATLGHETGVDGQEHVTANAATYLLGICAYIAVAFVQTYFLAGLCSAANQSLRGGDTSIRGGLQVANNRLHRILPWALTAATVSVILQAIEERFGIIGRIVGSMLGAAWNVITFLTVPIIVFEDLGPIDALRRSGSLFKATWGENIAAQVGLGMVGFLAMLPAILVIVFGAGVGGAVAVMFFVLAAAWVLVVAAVMSALSGIYRTALYRYAVDGAVPEAFAGSGLEQAFGPRRNRGRTSGGFGGLGGGFGGGFGGFTDN